MLPARMLNSPTWISLSHHNLNISQQNCDASRIPIADITREDIHVTTRRNAGAGIYCSTAGPCQNLCFLNIDIRQMSVGTVKYWCSNIAEKASPHLNSAIYLLKRLWFEILRFREYYGVEQHCYMSNQLSSTTGNVQIISFWSILDLERRALLRLDIN